MFKKVALNMSGTASSAVTAYLLKSKGFDVTAVFMKNWNAVNNEALFEGNSRYNFAKLVCEKLNIPFILANFVKEYWDNVFSNVITQIKYGKTPNPEIISNREIGFNTFFHFARTKLKADAIATGHYARTSFGPYLEYFKPNTDVDLLKAHDDARNQTFFLSQVNQEALRYSMFPLGDLMGSDVKEIADRIGVGTRYFTCEHKGAEFSKGQNFQEFLSKYIPDEPGDFISLDTGEIIGKHNGCHLWNIGQQINVPDVLIQYYVYKKDIENRNIFVVKGTNHPALYSDCLITKTPHWISGIPTELYDYSRILNCYFQFQYKHFMLPCTVHQPLNSNQLFIQLNRPLRAISRGQFAVFYSDEKCLGSAEISYPGPSYFFLDQEVRNEHLERFMIVPQIYV